MKQYEVLTPESILKIELLIAYTESYMKVFPNDKVLENITEVKKLIEEIKN
jgi:hypothetical protein